MKGNTRAAVMLIIHCDYLTDRKKKHLMEDMIIKSLASFMDS